MTIAWDASFGWTVVFTLTPTSPGTWQLEEQRTVGITVSASYSGPIVQATYHYHGAEQDAAFANLTNQSVVYVNGHGVPALGLDNASVAVNGSIAESATKTIHGHTASASLNVMGVGQASSSFSPSLGLVPLNLTGVNQWNSSATESPSASWDVSYAWADQGFNGTSGSGSGSNSGSLSGSGPVNLTGYKLQVDPSVFHDHKGRIAVVLVVQGVFDNYDGFILVPHDFDLFGSAPHHYDSMSLGSAAISAETLYLSSGPSGYSATAASSTFGSSAQAMSGMAAPSGSVGSAASPGSPGASVLAQPISVATANAEANCLAHGCSVGDAARPIGALLVALIGLAVAVVVATVGVIEWRSYARRRSLSGRVGRYGESWPNGVPPAGAIAPPQMGPSEGPVRAEDPPRRP